MQTVNNYKNFFKKQINFSFQLEYHVHSFQEVAGNVSDSKEGNRAPEFASRNLMNCCFFKKTYYLFFRLFSSTNENKVFKIKICRHVRNHNCKMLTFTFIFNNIYMYLHYIAVYNINENMREKLLMLIYFYLGSKSLKQAEYFSNRTDL